jgi:hypothetical protein
MRELLALPAWDTPPTPLEQWVREFSHRDQSPRLVQESGEHWIEIPAHRIRGYIVVEEGCVAAVNFELHAADPTESIGLLQAVASALNWELHEDTENEDADDLEDE